MWAGPSCALCQSSGQAEVKEERVWGGQQDVPRIARPASGALRHATGANAFSRLRLRLRLPLRLPLRLRLWLRLRLLHLTTASS